ncbi:4'-phosphopantetheinyl transferase family protein [Clostridium putrefaciens]|uniref:4'-phosphopantetheinyl transferase family protein n=1 Tax=Clostridium putrefaciens TaxID=99675 RepID=UPI003BFA6D83
MSNEYIKLNKNQYGKPYSGEYPQFKFNISHSGDYVLCSIDDKPIGVDIEEIKPIEYEEIAKNFLQQRSLSILLIKI